MNSVTDRRKCGWQQTKWGQLASLEYGKSLRDYDAERSETKPYRVFGTNGPIGWHSSALCEQPSVVVGRKGAYRGVHFSRDPFFVIDTAFYLKPKTEFDIRWAYFHLKNFDVNKLDSGSAIPSTSREAFYEIPVDLPPLRIQRRIAGILSPYDDLIENCHRRIQILESMAHALYREWFVHFRFHGHENHPRVASPLGEIPQGWTARQLGEIAEEVRRNVPKGALGQPQPYVGLEHIPRRSLALDAWDTTSELGSNKLAFKSGEILFGKIRPYFHKVTVAPFDGMCSADTIVIRSRRPENYAVVVGCVSSDAFVAHASATANGAKMPRASWDVLRKYPLVVPTGEPSDRFSALFEGIVAQQQSLVFKTRNLRNTRDLLLPRLLSGQVELQAA